MRVLPFLLLAPLASFAQQPVTTAPATGTTGTGAPTQNVVITVNGKKISFLLSPANIPSLQVNIPALTGTAALTGFTGTWSCRLGPNSQTIVNPDGTKSVTDVECTITGAK